MSYVVVLKGHASFWFLLVYSFPYAHRKRKLIAVGIAALCWTIWRTRNEACFQGNYPKDPANLVFLMCYWLKYWAGLRSV